MTTKTVCLQEQNFEIGTGPNFVLSVSLSLSLSRYSSQSLPLSPLSPLSTSLSPFLRPYVALSSLSRPYLLLPFPAHYPTLYVNSRSSDGIIPYRNKALHVTGSMGRGVVLAFLIIDVSISPNSLRVYTACTCFSILLRILLAPTGIQFDVSLFSMHIPSVTSRWYYGDHCRQYNNK